MSDTDFIYGRNSVLGMLETAPEKIAKIYIRDSAKGRPVDEIKELAAASRIPFQIVPGNKLYQMVGKVNDQGLVAQVSMGDYIELDDWLEEQTMETSPVVLILDEIEDAHNFGAIIRSAASSGVAGIIVGKHKQAPLNATVFKTSAGTLPLIPIIRVTNLSQALLQLKDYGFWICGTDQDASEAYWEQDLSMPLAIVVGNEGRGMRQLTKKNCDFMVRIPMERSVESLNASVSAALLSYEALRQRKLKSDA